MTRVAGPVATEVIRLLIAVCIVREVLCFRQL